MREPLGLTVFSKSYCPYSKRTKALLTSLNATFTVYEVDLRPDAHNLQPLLAQLTRHKTFPPSWPGITSWAATTICRT